MKKIILTLGAMVLLSVVIIKPAFSQDQPTKKDNKTDIQNKPDKQTCKAAKKELKKNYLRHGWKGGEPLVEDAYCNAAAMKKSGYLLREIESKDEKNYDGAYYDAQTSAFDAFWPQFEPCVTGVIDKLITKDKSNYPKDYTDEKYKSDLNVLVVTIKNTFNKQIKTGTKDGYCLKKQDKDGTWHVIIALLLDENFAKLAIKDATKNVLLDEKLRETLKITNTVNQILNQTTQQDKENAINDSGDCIGTGK